MSKFNTLALSTALLAIVSQPSAAEKTESSIVFNRDIRPILSQHCFACHGPDTHDQKGELRLDSLEAALKGGESKKAAIVPGKPEESELWKRIITEDTEHTNLTVKGIEENKRISIIVSNTTGL